MLARENKQDEHNPWAISIAKAPCHPHNEFDKIPPVASHICLTEEYAISDFTSVCRIQINLANAPPMVEIIIIGVDIDLEAKISLEETRISP